jgi:hypothetical protein
MAPAVGLNLLGEHATWIDAGVIGSDSGLMVNRFGVDVIDRHPEIVIILAGCNLLPMQVRRA